MSAVRANGVENAVLVEQVDRVLVITLNRPTQLNSINAALADHLAAAIVRLETDPHLSVGVIASTGRAFCSGMDLKAFAKGEDISAFTRFIRDGSTKPLTQAVR